MLGTDIGFILGKKEKKLSDSFSAIYRKPPKMAIFSIKMAATQTLTIQAIWKLTNGASLTYLMFVQNYKKSCQTETEKIC